MRVWILCEAFTLTGDAFGHQTVHESIRPWSVACESRKVVMRELKEAVAEAVCGNWEGADADEEIESDIRLVMNSKMHLGRGIYKYGYSTSDREVVWMVYPQEVIT